MDYTEVIENVKKFQTNEYHDDFLVDRLHHRYTIAGLICFCIAISTYDYLGNPIECWVPAQFNNNYEEYANRLCFLQNTYHIDRSQIVPREKQLRHDKTLKYYQWIPFVLLIQIFVISLPRITWQFANGRFGLSLSSLIDAAHRYQSFDAVAEQESGEHIQQYPTLNTENVDERPQENHSDGLKWVG